MSHMAKADRISAILLLLFALGVIAMATRMQMYAEFGPGAGFLPFWLGVLLALLSIMLFVNAGRYGGEHEEGSSLPTRQGAIRSAIAFVALIAYAALLGILGFVVDSLLAIGFLTKVLGRDTWKTSILIAVLGTLALYIIFGIALEVRLPSSLLGEAIGLPSGL